MSGERLHPLWPAIARRVVDGAGVRRGELIQVRGDTGRVDVLHEILLAIELAGATPLPEIMPPALLERLWAAAAPETLADWDRHRAGWLRQAARVITLHGGEASTAGAPAAAAAWRRSVGRLLAIEEERGLPVLVVALPVERRAAQLGLSLAELENALLPALAVDAAALRAEIDAALARLDGVPYLVLRTGGGHELRLGRAGRLWLSDDGLIDDDDRARGAVVSNLPAGSIYTTVVEDETAGRLWLPAAGPARDVVLTFEAGRIAAIDAATGAAELAAFLDGHSGEPRRVSHIGLGLNPALREPIGWTLVDEHLPGRVFLALGENRYMGGHNASSLNVDFVAGRDALLVPAV